MHACRNDGFSAAELLPGLHATVGPVDAAIVVDARYSDLFKQTHVRPLTVTTQVAEAAVRYPATPIVFAETRKLAQEWTYRFFGAAIEQHANVAGGAERVRTLPTAGVLPVAEPTTRVVRAWAIDAGFTVSDRGRLRPEVWAAYREHHPAD